MSLWSTYFQFFYYRKVVKWKMERKHRWRTQQTSFFNSSFIQIFLGNQYMANMEVSLQLHLSTVQPTNYYENRTKDAFQHCALSSIHLDYGRQEALLSHRGCTMLYVCQ